LIKGKRIAETKNEELEEDDEEDDADDTVDPEAGELERSMSRQESRAAKALQSSSKKVKHVKVHPDLSAITYLGTGKVKSFSAEISGTIPCDMMASYAEGTVNKKSKSVVEIENWINHNKVHLRLVFVSACLLS
jgi:hypothetical protein